MSNPTHGHTGACARTWTKGRGRRYAAMVAAPTLAAGSLVSLTGLTGTALVMVAPPAAAAGATIAVTTTAPGVNSDAECSLAEAIYAANRDQATAPDPSTPLDPTKLIATGCTPGSGADVIELPTLAVFTFTTPITDYDNYVGPSVTPIITTPITVEGHGARLQRSSAGQLTRAFVVGDGGNLDLREVHVKNFDIAGGDGADGGGGGMGAGGAIYADSATLRIQWSTFEANSATGGNGSYTVGGTNGGGGGGLFGDGGPGSGAGGGGGGSRGDGAPAPRADVGGGGGGRITDGSAGPGGIPCGGEGGHGGTLTNPGSDDGEDGTCRGGGGGGGTEFVPVLDLFCGGEGGKGSYGGGGGGGGNDGAGGDGGFGGGGGGNGGDAGFGAGGGAAGWGCLHGRGQGGTFGGDGGDGFTDGGGGGAGLGGAVFGAASDIIISNSTFTTNEAVRGLNGGGDSRDGRGAGGAVFTVAGNLSVESSTFAGNATTTVTGGGGGAITVYDPDGPAEATLRLRNSILAGNGASECYTRGGVTTTGTARNIITDSTANNLDNPACPGVYSDANPGLGPLQRNAPGKTPTMAIGATSVAADAADPTTSPLDDQRGIARPQGAGPDIGAYETNPTGPTTIIDLDAENPDGARGWYVHPVLFGFGATDPDGTVTETRCVLDPPAPPATYDDLPAGQCPLLGTSTDGTHTIYAGSIDNDGNLETPLAAAAFKLDTTPPTLNPALNTSSVTLGQTGVAVQPNATDATSGIDTASCGPVNANIAGRQTINCTAVDNAGNTTHASLEVVVEYRVLGFFSPAPKSKWRAGTTVPVKVALADAAGHRLTDLAAAGVAGACRVTFTATGAQPVTPKCLRYDPVTHQFVYNWKLATDPTGAATIAVTVSYPGTTKTTVLSEPIVIVR